MYWQRRNLLLLQIQTDNRHYNEDRFRLAKIHPDQQGWKFNTDKYRRCQYKGSGGDINI